MATIEWNLTTWGQHQGWQAEGEEWSETWGNSRAQWFGSILPRISRWLPASSILEIAPGFGRWTRYLREYAKSEFYGVDLSEICIQACSQRFNHGIKSRFVLNDGYSLKQIPDNSIDFIFSLDSLVHAEIDVLMTYIPQIIAKLRPNGIAFIHHSNASTHRDPNNPDRHMRAKSVSAELVEEIISSSEGTTLIQEQINWGSEFLTDCFTTFCRKESVFSAPVLRLTNPYYMLEAEIIRKTQSFYHTT